MSLPSIMPADSEQFDQLILNERLRGYVLPSGDDIPRSEIVFSDEHEVEDKALALIEKYVYSGRGNCVFEVNISSHCKYAMIQKSRALADSEVDLSAQQIYDLFDDVLLELTRLLNDSHIRFLQTEDYKHLFLNDAV